MRRTPFLRRALLPALLASALPSLALACPIIVSDGILDATYNLQYTDLRDIFLGLREGAYTSFGQCANNVDEDVAPALGLQYVRHIHGKPAHAVIGVPGSPLVTLEVSEFGIPADPDIEGTQWLYALRIGQSNSWPVYGGGDVAETQRRLLITLYSPGGPMRSVPPTDLGTITTTIRQLPANVMRQTLKLTVNVTPPTCTLSDASVTLDTVSADVLPAAGRSAGRKSFTVDMRCPFAGTPVKLTLTDAAHATNLTSALWPAPGSTASGVGIRVLRGGGAVIRLGTEWDHGDSRAGVNALPFIAEYLRFNEPLVAGTLVGQAVLTADYR